MVGLPRLNTKGGRAMAFIGSLRDEIAIIEQYQWSDGKPIFEVDTRMLRLILNPPTNSVHARVGKWLNYTLWDPTPQYRWKSTWTKFCSTKFDCLQWQILYRVLTTNSWRFQGYPQGD